MDELDLEFLEDGDAIHLQRKSTKERFAPAEEKRLIFELYEKHGIESRAQFQHNGFWGTNLRNDFVDGKPNRWNYSLPQGLADYKDGGWGTPAGAPDHDTWPRMYSQDWLNSV